MALLLDPDGEVVAAAPQPASQRLAELAGQLTQDAVDQFGNADPVEIDAVCEGGTLFLIRSADSAMVCVTDRAVLPPLIFYDMHAILTDLERAASAEARRVASAER